MLISASFLALAAAASAQGATPAGSPLQPPAPVPAQAPVQAPAAPPPSGQSMIRELPTPTEDPLQIDLSTDPVLGLARQAADEQDFLALVRNAVETHPRIDEAVAGIAEAEAAEDEARSYLYPSFDVSLGTQRSLSREFSDDPDNIIERSRSLGRTDLTLVGQQTIWDFGATANRVKAAGARLRAAAFDAEAEADQLSLRAIAAWYDVFAFRALVMLAEAFTANQQELKVAVQTRVNEGVSAPGDLPRVESYIAQAEADLARFERQLANAEARYEEVFGVPAAPGLNRAPVMQLPATTKAAAEFMSQTTANVESADAIARAAKQEARAERASTYPSLGVGVDAGKYGFSGPDYDIRSRATLRYRFLGAGDARADQAAARADQAEAAAARVRKEAEREAAVAWSDVEALEQQLEALEKSYVASRLSRDVLAERFRVARGTLFDLLESESSYFDVAVSYIRSITELDAARYVLLSRTGRLLPTLNINPPVLEGQ